MENVHVSTLEASVFMGKNYSENSHSIKNTGNDLTLKQMFDISDKLIVGQLDEIFGVTPSTGKILHGNSNLWSMKKKSSVSRMQMFLCIFGFCVMSWKGEREPTIKYCLGRKVELVQRFTTVQNLGHN